MPDKLPPIPEDKPAMEVKIGDKLMDIRGTKVTVTGFCKSSSEVIIYVVDEHGIPDQIRKYPNGKVRIA